jgi:hypothetical protein
VHSEAVGKNIMRIESSTNLQKPISWQNKPISRTRAGLGKERTFL